MTNEELIAWQRREQSPVEKALRRAYSLGQTYWQQADSESYSQNKKSDETAAKFEALVSETIAYPPQPAAQSTVTDEQIDAVAAQTGFGKVWYENARHFARAVLALASSAQAGEKP
ncbi:hypothetical protein J7E70_01895 [Variovorax paradoxus]|nr:hypothetical protein [Variovorax paradoxus]MBT2299207.1 hypothetical protein [Variovorax paradoxus]